MQHYHHLEAVNIDQSWVTIGSFDGVHIGHQAIIRRLTAGARRARVPSVVVTFHPHPAVVLGKVNLPSYLTTPDERAGLLGDLGVDVVLTLPFDRQLANHSALEFMQMLTARLGVRHLCIGYDFALGRGREGDVALLREIGRQLGYDLKVVEPVINGEGNPVSSSLIRRLISQGEMKKVAGLLGRNYGASGRVVHGDGRGKQLGFPTANLEVWAERLMPPTGIYATWTWIDGVRHESVANLGVRPTFENQPSSALLEVYIMDWHEDLYGQEIKVEFVERLRAEVRFPSVAALIEQIHLDIIAAREVLGHVA